MKRRVACASGLGLIVLVTLAGGLVLAQSDSRWRSEIEPSSAPAFQRVALPVRVAPIVRQSSYEVVDLHAGRVVAQRESHLGFEHAGRLAQVLVEPGDRVERGQLLARLDQRELLAERRERIARRDQLAARVSLARRTAARHDRLHAAGFLAPQTLDETRFGYAEQRAQLEAARASVESLDVRISLAEIRAPFAGAIIERLVDEGTVVAPGQVILRLVDHRREVHLGVPPELSSMLPPGTSLSAQSATGELGLELAAIVPEIEAATRTVRLVFDVVAGADRVRAGELVRIALPQRVEGEGFWLPVSGLTEGRRGLWSAFVTVRDAASERDGLWRLDQRQVDLLHTSGERAFVRGTLFEGDRVVIEGLHRLVPNQRVRVLGVGDVREQSVE